MTPSRGHVIANFVVFQANWFACILGAAAGYPWLGPVLVAVTATVHVAFANVGGASRRPEMALLVLAAIIGYAADSALVLGGVLGFPEATRLGGPSTLWMVALWVNFGGTLRWSLRWMRRRWIVAAVFGLFGGPLAYLAGERFGAVTFDAGRGWALGLVAVEWMIATPLLVWLAEAVEGLGAPRSTPVPSASAEERVG